MRDSQKISHKKGALGNLFFCALRLNVTAEGALSPSLVLRGPQTWTYLLYSEQIVEDGLEFILPHAPILKNEPTYIQNMYFDSSI